MFRVGTAANPFDDVVVKATDENLTSENWEYILDVCDRVSASDTGGKDAVAALIKRLAHRNANVQLYTLELANALSQNCGLKIHKELASRSFTDALLRLAGDRNTHTQVKTKILERMAEWTEMFAKDPDLGIMEQAYMRLKTQNPNLQPPSKPFKKEISAADRQKEDEELQMALALSIKDKQPAAASSETNAQSSSATRDDTPQQEQQSSGPVPSGTTAATVSRVRGLYDFIPSEAGELQFRKGDIITVLESVYKDWWKGSLRGQTGIFPLNYVEKLQDPTDEELRREALMEAEVFKEIRNVEKLLALLSTSGSGDAARDNEEITTLYHQTLSIRPKLIELIGKYSQKKDEFTQLNERFIKSRRDYEALLEQSMAHPPQQYGRPPPQARYGYGPPPGQDPYPPPQHQQSPPPQQQQQQDPARYYQQPSSPSQAYPPIQNGPAPFYVIAPGSQPQHQTHPGIEGAIPRPHSPTGHIAQLPDRKSGASFNSAQSAQELAAGQYDAPTDQRLSYVQQQPPQAQSSGAAYPPPGQDLYASHAQPPPQQQQQQQPQQPSQGPPQNLYPAPLSVGSGGPAPPQPGYAPPGVPGPISNAASPPPLNPRPVSGAYPNLGTGPGSDGTDPYQQQQQHFQPQHQPPQPPAGQYHAYQPSHGGYGPVRTRGGSATGDGDGEDFYR